MESKRQQKFSKLIQKDLSEIFQRDISDLLEGNFVTITVVRMSPDLGVAKVYCSILIAPDPKKIVKTLNENKSVIRNILGRRIKNQVRVIPDLIFFMDDTGEHAADMDKLISGLDIPEPSEDE